MQTRISAVVPVYRGADYLPALIDAIGDVRDTLAERGSDLELSELIFVDDASTDGSNEIIAWAASNSAWIHVVTLSRNFGQHPATMAGLLQSSGDWVVTMDEDLQHHPQFILDLLRKAVTEHADVVYGHPSSSVHDAASRDATSKLYKWLLARVAANPVISDFTSFRLCRGPVARAAAGVSGHETYLDIALTWFTDRFAFHVVDMTDRRFQSDRVSGYTFRKLLSHARRLLVSSHAKAMRLAALLGSVGIVLSVVFASRSVWSRLAGGAPAQVPGWTSLFVSTLLFGGIISFLLVVMSEYLVNIVLQMQGKPTFFSIDRSQDAFTKRALDEFDAAL